LPLFGCDDSDHDEAECLLVTELEPNDVVVTPASYVSQAQVLGEIFPGDCFTILGDLLDEVDTDGYGFFLFDAQTLGLTLSHSPLIDLDILLFDADTGVRITTCSTEIEPELCDVFIDVAGINVDVVVVSNFGTGNYTLDIESF
jgi:hypothetical protein